MKSLTRRQAEFLSELARGKSYAEIASDCFVARKTVNSTLEEARKRTETKTNIQCLALSIGRGELEINYEGYCYIPEE